jgi:hypothetical protein
MTNLQSAAIHDQHYAYESGRLEFGSESLP